MNFPDRSFPDRLFVPLIPHRVDPLLSPRDSPHNRERYSKSMSRRRWIADDWTDTTASLRGEQADHLVRVLRGEVGATYDIVAGGRVWQGQVASIEGSSVHFDLLAEVEAAAALPVSLMLSVFKFDRMEWAIEKAVELGVKAIQPVITRRTEKHLAQAAAKRAERWRRIALEAAKQSRAAAVAEIRDPLPLKTALAQGTTADGAAPQRRHLRLLLDETVSGTNLGGVLRAALQDPHASEVQDPHASQEMWIAVGPEGGWAEEEPALFRASGWQSVGLGPRILRAETAAIAALAVVSSALLE
jgi:16S rRNA (uracil1498-N3)-methyltransferase